MGYTRERFNMDHAEAARKFAVEQYILGELSETEREEFERHFFECTECAEGLEAGTVLVANAKSVLREAQFPERRAAVRERKSWFSFSGWGFAPAAALAGCAILAVLTGYQNLVQIPALEGRAASGDMVIAPAISVRAARSAQGLTFSKQSGMMSVTVAHEWEEPYTRYQGEIERAGGPAVAKAEIPATPGDITITAALGRFAPGSYSLNLYGLREGSAERKQVARIPFSLTE